MNTFQISTKYQLQEEIDFGDDIHREIDALTQLADGYGVASQGLPSDHRHAIKA